MSAVMSLLTQVQKSESGEPYDLLVAVVVAGLVARIIVTAIRLIITLVALAFGVLIFVEIMFQH